MTDTQIPNGLKVAQIRAMLNRVRDILAREPGKSDTDLKAATTEVAVKNVLIMLAETGMTMTEDATALARGLVLLAYMDNEQARTNWAEQTRQSYCNAVLARATRDGHVGADIISYTIN